MQYKAEFLWYSEADICIVQKLSGLLLFKKKNKAYNDHLCPEDYITSSSELTRI
jgi:hypothetical protein